MGVFGELFGRGGDAKFNDYFVFVETICISQKRQRKWAASYFSYYAAHYLSTCNTLISATSLSSASRGRIRASPILRFCAGSVLLILHVLRQFCDSMLVPYSNPALRFANSAILCWFRALILHALSLRFRRKGLIRESLTPSLPEQIS